MKKTICVVLVLLAVFTGSAQKKVQQKKLSPEIENWLKDELGKGAKNTSQVEGNLLQMNSFFTPGSRIKLVGYITDYDPGCGITTGMINVYNHITNEELPVVVEIYPDGRFKADIPSDHPRLFAVDFGRKNLQIYGEPGAVTAVVVDGNELLESNKEGNGWEELERIEYRGVLAKLNKQLMSVKLPVPDYNTYKEKKTYLTSEPETYLDYDKFIRNGMEMWEDAKITLEEAISRKKLMPETKDLLRKHLDLKYAGFLLRFAYRKSMEEREMDNPVPDEYFHFLSQLSWKDPSLMIFDDAFSEFINQFQFCTPLRKAENTAQINSGPPEKSFIDFLKEDKCIVFAEEDKTYLALVETLEQKGPEAAEDEQFMQDIQEWGKLFMEKYEEHVREYIGIYIDPAINIPFSRRLIQSWRRADKAMKETLSLPSGIINEMVKVRSMDFILRNCDSQEEADEVLACMLEDLTTLFFREEAQRMYDLHFGGMTYELPEGRAGNLFREIIAPFKGKYLLVDFWGIFCGPCVYGIKTMKEDRDRLKGDEDIEFLFITSEEESPIDRYNAFIKEQELEHTFLLSADDYRYMRELFGFNGIPRYILVGREGEILSDNYQGSLFLDKIRDLTGRTDI